MVLIWRNWFLFQTISKQRRIQILFAVRSGWVFADDRRTMKSLNLKEAKIAWIGAGTMGGPMAGNLAKAGYRVTIWNRTQPSAGAELAASRGCAVAKTIDEALKGSQVVCSCVTDGPALRSVLFAPG